MNIIWLLIVLVTILYRLMTGNVGIINDVFLNVGKETLDFVIPPQGVTCSFWNGIFTSHETPGSFMDWNGCFILC